MSELPRAPRQDEPKLEIWYYYKETHPGGITLETMGLELPIEKDEMVRLSKMECDDILTIPPQALEHFHERVVALDQIARINVKTSNLEGDRDIARFFINDVIREVEEGSHTNRYRAFIPEDDEWVTVAQARRGWGIFEMSIKQGGDFGSYEMMRPFLLEPSDKVVRLIGEDFRVIDPRTEAKPVAAPAPTPG